MSEQEIVHAIVGAGSGGGIVLIITKFLFQKLVKYIEDSTEKIHEIFIKVSAMDVKMDYNQASIQKLTEVVHSHDIKIATLHEKVHFEDGKRRNSKGSAS